MPRKNPGERWRYIAFSIEGETPVTRNDFLGSLLHASKGTPLQDSFRITVFEGDFGILKVPHKLKDESIAVLTSMNSLRGVHCKVVTLKTSGTIKTLKQKYADRIESREDTY